MWKLLMAIPVFFSGSVQEVTVSQPTTSVEIPSCQFILPESKEFKDVEDQVALPSIKQQGSAAKSLWSVEVMNAVKKSISVGSKKPLNVAQDLAGVREQYHQDVVRSIHNSKKNHSNAV